MQDRFKFRLYDKAISEMVYDVCVGFIKDSGKTDDWVCADTSCGQITYRDDKLKDIILMQCTGLQDKNGKLIYEGDIVEAITHNPYEKHIGVIQFHTCYFSLDYIKLGKYSEAGISLAKNTGDFVSLKIIGNIYENPELLEKIT